MFIINSIDINLAKPIRGTTMETESTPDPRSTSIGFTLNSQWLDEAFGDTPAKCKPTLAIMDFLFSPETFVVCTQT